MILAFFLAKFYHRLSHEVMVAIVEYRYPDGLGVTFDNFNL